MSGLLYLTSEDFDLINQNGKQMMKHSINGFSLILFYSNMCKFCPEYTNIFKAIPGSVSGCQFGILNVDTNKNFINASKNTISQINYVPFILLYVNGIPFMKYNGPPVISEIARFIIEVSKNIQQKQKFSSEVVKKDPNGGIPSYSIGHPLKNMVCFLEFEEAYKQPAKK